MGGSPPSRPTTPAWQDRPELAELPMPGVVAYESITWGA
jgi:hypothetical protein